MKKILIFIIFVAVGMVLAIFVTGAMLPVKHSVSRSITVHQPAEAVWAVLADHMSDPKWRHDVASVKKLPNRNGHPVWEDTYKNGQTLRIETTVLDFSGTERMERKIVDQTSFGGTWVYEIIPLDDPAKPGAKMTKLKITENGEVYNPAFRFIGTFIIGNDKTVTQYLKDFAAKFGENVVPTP